jgi:hypothetical protein
MQEEEKTGSPAALVGDEPRVLYGSLRLCERVAPEKVQHRSSGKMIQDKIPLPESMQRYVLLIPEAKTGVIQDEIILRRVGGSTFAAYG